MDSKVCSKCGGEPQPLENFGKHKGMADGHRPDCKKCVAVSQKTYRKNNAEKLRTAKQVYYYANRETILEKSKLYSKDHSKEIVERVRHWELANPDKVKINHKKYKLNNKTQIKNYNSLPHIKEKSRVKSKEWRYKNPAKRKLVVAKWASANKDKIRAKSEKYKLLFPDYHKQRYQRYKKKFPELLRLRGIVNAHKRHVRLMGNGGSHTVKEWEDLKAKYNYTCLRCGKKEPEIKLTLDHVFPLILGGTNDIKNVQSLCGSCNSSKGGRFRDYRKDSPTYGEGWKRPSLWG